jgi:hypothetical protein
MKLTNKITRTENSCAAPSILVPGHQGNNDPLIAWADKDKKIWIMDKAHQLTGNTKIQVANETCVDGPVITDKDGHFILAWTGTDANKHLNIRVSDPQQYLNFTHKLTLDETSPCGPAIASSKYGEIVIAWIGSGNKKINLAKVSLLPNAPFIKVFDKITLNEKSNDTPALTFDAGNTLCLAWTGTNNKLNLIKNPFAPTPNKTTYNETSKSGPCLSMVFTPIDTFLGWVGKPNNQLNIANFPTPAKTTFADTSEYAYSCSFPYIAWAGTDKDHHLNVAKLTY